VFFGYSPITAVGTDLAYGAVTKTVGGWKHLRQRTVDRSLSLWISVGSVPAAIAGVYVLTLLEDALGSSFDAILLGAVAAALLITGVAVLARALFLPKLVERERDDFKLETRHKVSAIVLGVFVGFVLGVTSAGSGSLIAVGLILIFRLTPQKVVGTDVFQAAILLWAAAIAHIIAGNVDFALAGTILLGSVPGVLIGSHLSVRIPVPALRTALGIVLVGAGLGIATKAGVDIPPVVVAAVPVVLAVAVIVQSVRRPKAPRPAVKGPPAPLPQAEPY
jgi:uncharacterized membrane protein YfcA